MYPVGFKEYAALKLKYAYSSLFSDRMSSLNCVITNCDCGKNVLT